MNYQPITDITPIPIEHIFEQFCEICNKHEGEVIVETKTDSFYCCLRCLHNIAIIANLTKYLEN